MKDSEERSKRVWAKWKKALAKGECWIGGCNISKKTCQHLDARMDYGRHMYEGRVGLYYTDMIEEEAGELRTTNPAEGCWDMYKKLKGYGLQGDQILILLRKFVLGMNTSQIKRDMGWTSWDTLYSRYRAALRHLKKKGYKG